MSERPSRLRPVPALPAYTEHGGRPVTWDPWRLSRVMCLPARECPGCGSSAEAYFSAGTIQPRPGDTVTVVQDRPSKRQPGRVWGKETEVAQWPYYGLAAFACPDCPHVEVYDTEDGFRPVDTTQPTLF